MTSPGVSHGLAALLVGTIYGFVAGWGLSILLHRWFGWWG